MKSFAVVESTGAADSGKAIHALSAISTADKDNHYWIDANAVIALSAKSGDVMWLEAFWNMLRQVEAYGYSNMDKKLVKAHVKTR